MKFSLGLILASGVCCWTHRPLDALIGSLVVAMFEFIVTYAD